MALSGLDRRASKLEDSMDGLKRQKEADERKAWREANSERLKWEMFLRNHGPESIDWTEEYIEKYPDEKEDLEAGIACREMIQRVLAKYKGHVVDYEDMDSTQKAFAYLLEEFCTYMDTYRLFDSDLDYWQNKLGLDDIRPPFVELIRAIDEHTGSPDWREICYLQTNQDFMMKRLFESYEDGRTRYLRYKAEHPD
jgi:antitoxin component HigA of HigAB toxin-antitoxin module